MPEYHCAVDDPNTPFSHVAFRWDAELEGWAFLCAGRTMEEFQQRVQHWIDKGQDPACIRKYSCQLVVSVAVPQAPPQPAQNAEHQPQLISEELWAVIKAKRPGAYETLKKYNVQYAIIKVGTSRTKLEFPVLPNAVRDDPEWQEFDTHTLHVTRPIIVLDGTPENGFKPISWLHGLPGNPERNNRS